jgi:mxaJ protein
MSTLRRRRMQLFAATAAAAIAIVVVIASSGVILVHGARVLRVCADPNNLPFSNARREGFENRLADLIAQDLHARVEYTWWAQRRGFIRNTLNAGQCDVVMGVPSHFDLTTTTRPYYRSTYVFVTRADRHLQLTSFDDPRLRALRIGVQLIGDDFANTPPAHALSARGIVANVEGFMIYGDYARANPPARIIDAVAHGDIDVAIAWGPLAGYFASREPVALHVQPVSAPPDLAFPFTFEIALGVRRGNEALKAQLNDILERRQPDINRLLDDYGIPRAKADAS